MESGQDQLAADAGYVAIAVTRQSAALRSPLVCSKPIPLVIVAVRFAASARTETRMIADPIDCYRLLIRKITIITNGWI